MRRLKDEWGAEVGWGKGKAAMEALSRKLLLQVKKAEALGALDKGSVEVAEDMVPSSSTFRERAGAMLEELERGARSGVDTQAQALGYEAGGGAPVHASGRDAEALEWARKNPGDPRAARILQMNGAG
jgi:hypothetical protein